MYEYQSKVSILDVNSLLQLISGIYPSRKERQCESALQPACRDAFNRPNHLYKLSSMQHLMMRTCTLSVKKFNASGSDIQATKSSFYVKLGIKLRLSIW